MKRGVNISIIALTVLFFACTNKQKTKLRKNEIQSKDIINAEDINSEFRKRLNFSGEGVKTEFFDKTNKLIRGNLVKDDTFYVQVKYISDTFHDLAKNHEIELLRINGDFNFLDKVSKNRYKIVTGHYADTIEYDVFIRSKKYIFNDYYLKNRMIKYKLVDKISLCRLKNIVN